MTAAATSAVLFDIDGTLVDSNYLHVHAWSRAFAEAGHPVEAWRIHRSIGMDGAALIETLTPGADEQVRARAKELHKRYYTESAPQLRCLPGARELIEAVHRFGIQVVLATSAPEDELSLLREVLDVEDLLSAVTSAEDVDVAKPKPDIVEVALDRAGVVPAHAVFVGDTVWDMTACARAGVVSIGVRSGGVSDAELESSGAQRVFDHPLDLCQHLDDTPVAALANIVGAR
ncbi:HAD family hydrolase [Mycolicibacterium phlei]